MTYRSVQQYPIANNSLNRVTKTLMVDFFLKYPFKLEIV